MKLIYFRHNKNGAMPPMPPERIYYIELTLLLHGELEYNVNRNHFPLRSGDVIFVPQDSVRSRKKVSQADYVSFNFFPEEGDELYDLPNFIHKGVAREISLLLNTCDEIHAQLLPDEEQLCLILRCILKQLKVNLDRSAYSPLVHRVKNYVFEHIQSPLTLDEIAKEMNFSKSYLSAVFKKETGLPLISYVLGEKIQEAKIYIANGVPLNQVSTLCGFTDYNYFSRLFKKKVSYTPLQYRNLLSAK